MVPKKTGQVTIAHNPAIVNALINQQMTTFYKTGEGIKLTRHIELMVTKMWESRGRLRGQQSIRERFIRIYHHAMSRSTQQPDRKTIMGYVRRKKDIIDYMTALVKSDCYHFLTKKKPWGTSSLNGLGFSGKMEIGVLKLTVNPNKIGDPTNRRDRRYMRFEKDFRQLIVQFILTPTQRRLEGRK